MIGFAAGGATPRDAIPKFPLNLALLNERQILGCFWGAWKMQDGGEANRECMAEMMHLVEVSYQPAHVTLCGRQQVVCAHCWMPYARWSLGGQVAPRSLRPGISVRKCC